ncbi:hypothetical protein HN51_028425 [Arachis hypogaea]
MSQSVDKTSLKTLAVVTKVDKSPEGLLEKVTADDVNIGLGYVCARNRIGDESYEEARIEEERLFESHPMLSKIDKSIVGVPVLAQRLVQVQGMIISKTLSEIVKKVNEKLTYNLSELDKLHVNLTCVSDAMTAFMHIIGLSKESLRKILLRGEFDEYPEEKNMHCTARLVDLLDSYSNDLQCFSEKKATEDFLMDEIRELQEAKLIGLPNFMPRTAFLSIHQTSHLTPHSHSTPTMAQAPPTNTKLDEKVDYFNLPCPIPFEELHREAFISLKPKLFEGMRFDFTKMLNQKFSLNHSISMGPTEIPSQSTETIKISTANYKFGATFIDHPKLMLLGRILTDGRLSARVKCDVSENLTLKANAQLMNEPHMSQGMVNFDYKFLHY